MITAHEGQEAGWFAAQDKLAGLSSDSVHRTVHGAEHIDLLDNQQYAMNSSTAIDEIVTAVRTHTPVRDQ